MERVEGRVHGLRRVVLPLMANHVLILVGAWFLVSSDLAHRTTAAAVGASVLAGGIAIELAVLLWSASLVRAAARSTRGTPAASMQQRSRCISCGWSGVRRVGAPCPRCSKPIVPFL